MDHGHVDPRLTTLGGVLVVLREPPVSAEPPERPLHHPPPLLHLEGRLPRLARVWADAGYKALAGWVAGHCRWVLEVVSKRAGQTTFEVHKWRWIVERTFGWFGRYRRLSKDYEHNPKSSEAWIYIAMIHRMSRFDLPEKNKDDDLLRRPPKRPKP